MQLAIEWVPALEYFDINSDTNENVDCIEENDTRTHLSSIQSVHRSWIESMTYELNRLSDIENNQLCNYLNKAAQSDEKSLIGHFSELWVSKEYFDCVVVTETAERHKTHRFILTIHSEFFSALLSDRWSNQNSGKDSDVVEVFLTDCSDTHLDFILRYMYTGSMDDMINESNLLACLLIANRLMIQSLIPVLCERLTDLLQLHNAAQIYMVADRMNLESLKPKALNLLIRNYHIIISENLFGDSVDDTDTTSSDKLSDYFSENELKSLEILNAFYRRAADRDVTIDHSITRISEILAICFEAVDEAQERYIEAKQQNDVEISECEAAITQHETQLQQQNNNSRGIDAMFSFANYFPTYTTNDSTTTSLKKLRERFSRLAKVRSALRRQEHRIEMQRAFLATQQEAYYSLSVLGHVERKQRQQEQKELERLRLVEDIASSQSSQGLGHDNTKGATGDGVNNNAVIASIVDDAEDSYSISTNDDDDDDSLLCRGEHYRTATAAATATGEAYGGTSKRRVIPKFDVFDF